MLTQHVWECKTCNLQSYVLLSWIMARQVCFLKAMCLWWFRKTHVMLWQVKFFSSSLLSQLFLLYSLSFSCMIVSWDCICALKFAVEYTVELPPGLYKLELVVFNKLEHSERKCRVPETFWLLCTALFHLVLWLLLFRLQTEQALTDLCLRW